MSFCPRYKQKSKQRTSFWAVIANCLLVCNEEIQIYSLSFKNVFGIKEILESGITLLASVIISHLETCSKLLADMKLLFQCPMIAALNQFESSIYGDKEPQHRTHMSSQSVVEPVCTHSCIHELTCYFCSNYYVQIESYLKAQNIPSESTLYFMLHAIAHSPVLETLI